LEWLGIVVVVLVIVLACAGYWLLRTGSGARFVLERATSALDGKLSVRSSDGALTGPLTLDGVAWRDPQTGVDARIGHVALDLAALPLFAGRVHVRSLVVDGVDVALTTVPQQPEEPPAEFSLEAPLDILLDRARVTRIAVQQDGQPVFAADSLDLGAAWTGEGVLVRELALRAPDGQVDLHGTVTALRGYPGQGEITFRWKVAEVEYAGSLTASGNGSNAEFHVTLSAPTPATLAANLVQNDDLDWTMRLDVPGFDPRVLQGGETPPESAVQSIALALQGAGNRSHGTVAGDVDLDAHRVQLHKLAWVLDGQTVRLDALEVTSPEAAGTFRANGTVQLDAEPVSAVLQANWDAVELPADLVGQALATHGSLELGGSANAYHAEGAFALGPPGQLADITIDLDGTPEVVNLNRVALVQESDDGAPAGLDAHGRVDLQPAIGWQVDATANRFNPGAFFADWPGAIDFQLATQGHLTDDGPDATVKLTDLDGKLRERALSGHADLAIQPGYRVSGEATVAAGGSRVDIRGRSGDTTDATVKLAVESLADWLPDAGGSVDGTFHVSGAWPELNVKGGADGAKIAYGTTRVEGFRLNVDVTDMRKPHGHVDLAATGVGAGALAFDNVKLDADGNEAAHSLDLDATGPPLTTRVALEGGRRDGNWNARLTTLDLDVNDVPPFRLSEPAQLAWDGNQFRVADTCLAGGETRLCIGATTTASGELDAHYELERLPLTLVASLAAPDAPLVLAGEIGGNGNFRRDAGGALTGTANLASPEGSVAYADQPGEPLLAYTGLAIDANLAPDSTRATLRAALDHDGRLDGEVTLSGPAGSPQALGGRVDARLGSLAFVELLSPEVANVEGTLAAHYTFAGTTAAPQFAGTLELAGFAAEIPSAGLELHDGDITATAHDAQHFDIEGTLASGDGKLVFGGGGGIAGGDPAKITIRGENFLAADIPAARVVITPDLVIQRSAERIEVGGSLTIPKANVDLAKLPGGGVTAASPDVVIVDAEQVESGAPLPVVANVTVSLGKDVKLAGFGLDGKVGGDLKVAQKPGRAATGTGTINVSGTYKAYGQDLKIETGRLLFAGTPLDNPGLDIKAARTIRGGGSFGSGDITAGLMVRGTALAPVLTVYSEPVMAQSEALSYIVTGKPLSGLKSGEGDMLGTAARALGTAGGDLLAKGLGTRLGVDATVSDSTALGGAAFTVGKYLSPKLYLSYGVGVFDPGQVVTLRYLMSRRFNFEAENATTGTRAGLNYRYER
jgi:translocation and assembly module TamB